MRTRKTFGGGQRRRQLNRHHHKMTNRRLVQFVQTLMEEKTS